MVKSSMVFYTICVLCYLAAGKTLSMLPQTVHVEARSCYSAFEQICLSVGASEKGTAATCEYIVSYSMSTSKASKQIYKSHVACLVWSGLMDLPLVLEIPSPRDQAQEISWHH